MMWDVLNTWLLPLQTFLWNLAGAIVLLLIGWLVGTVIGRVVREILVRLKVDQYIIKGKPTWKISSVFSLISRWAIYLMFIAAAVNILNIQILTAIFSEIITFIGGLIKAIVVIIVGYILAEYVRKEIVKGGAAFAGLISKGVFWLIIYIAVAIALPLIGIDTTILTILLGSLAAGIGVGLAIAIGWGLKDTVNTIAKKYVKKLK